MKASPELLQAIELNVRAGAAQVCQEIAVGPFVALLHPGDPALWYNYAVPAAPLPDEVAALTALAALQNVFSQRDRTIRFEFTAELWPALPELLLQAGLQPERASPQMICAPEDFRPCAAAGVAVRLLGAADSLADYRSLTSLGFGRLAAATEAEVSVLRREVEAGWRYAVAEIEGVWAGVGGYLAIDGLTELVAIATHPAFRRRGVASSLTSFLVSDHF
ncbi:MAG TPA: GNAT family N-acetyltransferase, partial [Herpetosiphonaceae bacterium]|nr:GNAT family N-acetyltransferase [Herpetosiphonaceae bacterium]